MLSHEHDMRKEAKVKAERGKFFVEGQVQIENAAEGAQNLRLMAFAFSPRGELLGQGAVGEKGEFSLDTNLRQAADVELVVSPERDPKIARKSQSYREHFSVGDWRQEEGRLTLRPNVFLPRLVWFPWLPLNICLAGIVRKEHGDGGYCPVPYVKVEIFDVDRESCWWLYIQRWLDVLVDRPVIRIPELVKERPPFKFPIPLPDPPPFKHLPIRALREAQPLALRAAGETHSHAAHANDDPDEGGQAHTMSLQTLEYRSAAPVVLGEVQTLAPEVGRRLSELTLNSKIAPWLIFPHCFYSKQLICTTYTDYNGGFQCCFKWYPFHFRNGRLRFDARPDIIVRVTQVVNGVTKVIYLDPYTSTRWNMTNGFLTLTVDDAEVLCGGGDDNDRPAGTMTFLTRVGNDEVYQINQATGLYNDAANTNVAYGSTLDIHGVFGADLSDGSPARYYRLSYAKAGSSNFTPLTGKLDDTRVNRVTAFSDTENLGPLTVNGQPALYKVRDTANYLWYNVDLLNSWNTAAVEEDTGKYILRLEVFDQNGVKMTSATVDYRDGTSAPGGTLPNMTDKCDLVLTLDNKAPDVNLHIPNVLNDCGVIERAALASNSAGNPLLPLTVQVSQENGRLHSWSLSYKKGTADTVYDVAASTASNGSNSADGLIASGATNAPLNVALINAPTTCAYALILNAQAHIRNGYTFIYHVPHIEAIAIENCVC